MADGHGRDQHLSARQPAPSLDHKVAHDPRAVIEIEILHVTDNPVGCTNGVILQILHAA